MKKFLCYDTNDVASGKINVDSRGVLKSVGSSIPSTDSAPFQQLVTDGNGEVKWGTLTLPVVFTATNDSSSATIKCPYGYEELRWHLNTNDFLIMSGQLYIESSKNLFTMTSCTQKDNRLEFSFVFPQDASSGLMLGVIVTVYYLENGTITFTRPVEQSKNSTLPSTTAALYPQRRCNILKEVQLYEEILML